MVVKYGTMITLSVTLSQFDKIKDVDCVVLAVGHEEFKALSVEAIEALFNPALPNKERVLIDIKSILDSQAFTEKGYHFWRL